MTETVLDLFERSSSRLIFADGAAVDTNEIVDRGGRLVSVLARHGLQAGDRMAVRLPNGAAYLVALAAAAIGRFVLVSVNSRFSEAEADDLVARSGAKALCTDDPAGTARVGVEVIGPEMLRTVDGAFPATAPRPTPTDRFVVFTTSGTTGAPKMVVHSHRSIAVHARSAADGFGITADDTVLAVMPLCGTFGLATLMSALAGDATIVLPDRFEPESTAALVRRHRVTVTHGSDDMFHRLLTHDADLGTLRIAGHARFNASLDDIVERADQRGATLVGLYGMSEVQALFAHRDGDAAREERARAGGRPVSDDATFRVVDGELQLRGPSLFEGYLAHGGGHVDRALTDAHLDDGWFRTGDLAIVDPVTTTFTFLTRMGDAMRLGGFLVAPAEIEDVVLELPGVVDTQVVAAELPSGTRPVAFVILDRGATFDAAAAHAHCAERLSRHKVPVRFEPVEHFPVTDGPNGVKVRRDELRRVATNVLGAGGADRPPA